MRTANKDRVKSSFARNSGTYGEEQLYSNYF